jgi:hypothetical protein
MDMLVLQGKRSRRRGMIEPGLLFDWPSIRQRALFRICQEQFGSNYDNQSKLEDLSFVVLAGVVYKAIL